MPTFEEDLVVGRVPWR